MNKVTESVSYKTTRASLLRLAIDIILLLEFSRTMETEDALTALMVIAHDSGLAVFRVLVRKTGGDGRPETR